MKRLGIVIDDSLHTEAKVKAFTSGKTLTQYMVDLIEKDLGIKKENE